MEDLFEMNSMSLVDDEVNDVRQLISEFSILSNTRPTSKCWQDLFKYMHQIVSGTFLGAHDFDQSWFTKVCGKYDVFSMTFTWPELVMRTRAILEYIVERKPQGFWYPRADKISLPDFFCSLNRKGKCWSPFLELNFVDCVTPQMFRKMFGPKICEKIDEIAKDLWFQLDYDAKVKFYRGIDNLHNWFLDIPDDMIDRCEENKLVFGGKFSGFLEIIRQCNKETKFLYPQFTNPNIKNWGTFVEWTSSKKGLKW